MYPGVWDLSIMSADQGSLARGVKATALWKRTELQVKFFLYRGSLGLIHA